MTAAVTDPTAELDRQLHLYASLGYPALAGTSDDRFRSQVERLRAPLAARAAPPRSAAFGIPFLLVVPGLRAEDAMPLTRQGERPGYVDQRPVAPASFAPVEGLEIPDRPYLALDVDTGRDTLGIAPRDALPLLSGRGRSPLTIAEGVALITAFPGVLRAENCFQMLASRRGDKRIPSLWVTRAGAPRLGWCFEGVPHTWLGAASCAGRLG